MSVPRRKENGTAPKRVACQSPADRTAEEINHKSGKEGILPMAGEIFMRVNEVAEELGVSVPYLYIEQMLSYSDDGSYTHYYKCPCGQGRVVDDKDATPGFRSHDILIECAECREKYEIV